LVRRRWRYSRALAMVTRIPSFLKGFRM